MRALLNSFIVVSCLYSYASAEENTTCSATNNFGLLSLPEIDVNQYLNGNSETKQLIADIVDDQLHNFGMFRITNHGLSTNLMNEFYVEVKAFFDQTDEFKSNYESDGDLGSNGWERVGTVNAAASYNSSAKPDPVESVIIWYIQLYNNNMSDDETNELYKYCPKKLCQVMQRYAVKARQIDSILFDIFTLSLGLNYNQFELDATDINDVNIKNHYFNEFRLWNYFDLDDEDGMIKNKDLSDDYRFGAHSDFSTVNLLLTDDVVGLQIKLDRKDNKWYTISNDNISADSIVVNMGEVMEMYTSGYWLAPRHRVARLSTKRRISIAYFVGPNFNRVINEIDHCQKCKQNRNQTIMQRYELPITYREHANMRFGASFQHNQVVW